MKKILILANASLGLCNFRFELIKKLLDEGYEVYFALPESIKNERVRLIAEAGAKHIQTHINRRGMNPFEDLKLVKTYKTIIKKLDPELILSYTIKPNVYGSYAANRYGKPVIMNITGIGSSLTTGNLKSIVKRMYKYACNKSEVVFFQNKENHSYFLKNNIVDINKTKLIPGSGVNIGKFRPMEKTVKDNIIRFLFIGRIMKEKGVEEYIQAADSLTKKYNNIEFQILGRFEEEKYKKIILDNKNPHLKYLGVSSDVRNEIREADCIVNPSYHEGMSNVLLEGAAMGKPLIASNISGCKEIIENGYNGYLFEVKSVPSLEEKLVQFIELDVKKRELMARNSRKKVEVEFDRNIVINEYMKAINEILSKKCQKNDMK